MFQPDPAAAAAAAAGSGSRSASPPPPALTGIPTAAEFLPGTLAALPPSRYLSEQRTENPISDMNRRGYDPNYRMIAPRRIDTFGGEDLTPNPASGAPRHVVGARTGALLVQIPRETDGPKDTYTSEELFKKIDIEFMGSRYSKLETTLRDLRGRRAAALRTSVQKPRVAVIGLGPVGLLTVLEAYTRGSNVIGFELRAQYTRPQVLRLTVDTLNRIRGFVGIELWNYFIRRGIVSRSPNWLYNKFDGTNNYIPPARRAITAADTAFLDQYPGRERETVEIIRINQLETILAALIERIAKADPDAIKLYYGAEVSANPARDTLSFKLFDQTRLITHPTDPFVTRPFSTDILLLTEGAGRGVGMALGLMARPLSDILYGATVALRLPVGFDIGLRPIENAYGSASVIGIAQIDADKLGTFDGRTWSMIGEQDLCRELNGVVREAYLTPVDGNAGLAAFKGRISVAQMMLPCEHMRTDLSARGALPAFAQYVPTSRGGTIYYLPRSRYFFTGGIAYLGGELTENQYNLLRAVPGALKKYMLVLAKKHMPRQYIEGAPLLGAAPAAAEYFVSPTVLAPDDGMNFAEADRARDVKVAEERYSLTSFAIQLTRADSFYNVQTIGPKRTIIMRLGDSYATTHFFTGSGAVNGLRAAILVGGLLERGVTETNLDTAANDVNRFTDRMHGIVMRGEGNAPLDGPFNNPLAAAIR